MLLAIGVCLIILLVAVIAKKYEQATGKNRWLSCARQIAQELEEAVLLIDGDGTIRFMNRAAEKLFRCKNHEAFGANHRFLFQEAADLVQEALAAGEDREFEELELFTTAGKPFEVDLRMVPLRSLGSGKGMLCLFRRAHEKLNEPYDRELEMRDALTGLYNRKFFDVELERLDSPENWPLSILIGDLNGLKLTNDIFGHSVGDELLVTVAEVLKRVFRPEDRIFRWGGDEFVVLMPQTSQSDAAALQERLAERLEEASMGPVKIYMPLGHATKTESDQDIEMIWQQAEEQMYWHKTVTHSSFLRETLANVVKELHSRNGEEKEHAERVSRLAEEFGRYLGLNATQLRKARLAGFLHDVGKVALDPELLYRPYPLKTAELYEMKRHPLVGFRLLNFFDDTLDIAGSVLAHHEHWDGGGFPKGLKGEEIPYLGRMLAIIETYDRICYDPYATDRNPEAALAFIEGECGKKFDPELGKAFVEMMRARLPAQDKASSPEKEKTQPQRTG